MSNDLHAQAIQAHLADWGLREFLTDSAYFAWQRERLTAAALEQLAVHVERKRNGHRADEVAFYDLTARPDILPVLYSQRYHYYCEVGRRVAGAIGSAATVLDVGCGIGILTTFYARRFPHITFVGIDRSPSSLAVANAKANELGLCNVRFECCDIEQESVAGTYDVVVATHALVQAEFDPGIPSADWRTFERRREPERQAAFEGRTGLAFRLERLDAEAHDHTRLIVFEKTRQLARRVPFQRALAARGWSQTAQPELVRYREVEDITDDGPLYILAKQPSVSVAWEEGPEADEGPVFTRDCLTGPGVSADGPLYENHFPSAQGVWESLPGRVVREEATRQASDGRQLHVELGTVGSCGYLYCANTFDQRQLIVVAAENSPLIESYYREILTGQGA